jgi:imidazolonepropionase-like amidohydrolase
MKMSKCYSFLWSGLAICFSHALTAQCSGAPDLVITNAHIITLNPLQPEANTIAIRDGLIQAIGDLEEIINLMPQGCPVSWIDANTRTILPGFNDAHCHWLSWPEHLCDAPGLEQTTYPPLDEIMDTLSLHGWTSISELNFGRPDFIPEHLQHAMELEASGNLNVRLNGYWGTYDNVDLIDALETYGYEPGHMFSDRIRAPGVKMYIDDPFGTTDIMDQSTCNALVAQAHDAGYQVAAHAVNESAVEKILTAYESALGALNNYNRLHRIEHVVKVNDDQFNRMENKGIVASFQLMGPPDWPEQNTFQTYISQSNTSHVLRWKDFTQSSIPIVGSTDAPFNNTVCDYSPFRAIYQAVTRMGYLDRNHAPWELTQQISIEDALKLLTIDGAWVTGEEGVKGNLMVGKYADLTIVSDDPLAVAQPEDLLDIRSLMTMVGGEIEYCLNNDPVFCEPPFAFVVDTMLIIVSHFTEDGKPYQVIDQDEETIWNAGDFPPQFIRFDLLQNTSLEKVEMVVSQFPAGFTRHQLLGQGDDEGSNIELLHEFAGTTVDQQELAYSFLPGHKDFRYLTLSTLQSPSWVAWREIRIFKDGATSLNSGSEKMGYHVRPYPNPVKDELFIEITLPEAVSEISITLIPMDGKETFKMFVGPLSSGTHTVNIDPIQLQHAGNGNLIMVVNAQKFSAVLKILRP